MAKLLVILCIVSLVLLGSLTFADEQKEKEEEKPVAIVNGESILKSDLDRNMKMAIAANPNLNPSFNKQAYLKMRNEILDYLINQELMYQEGKKSNLVATEVEIEEKVTDVKKNFPDQETFEQVLKQQDLTEKRLRELIARVITMQKVIEAKIKPLAKPVTDKDVADFYESHKEGFKETEKVKARHILIKVDSNANEQEKAEAKKKIESVLNEINKDGSNFADMAKKYSQCPTSIQGGDLGYFHHGQMVKPFEDAAFALQPGQVSEIVETEFGYHIIFVEDKKPERQLELEEVSEQIKEALTDEQLDIALANWIKPAREKASIKILLENGNTPKAEN
ncbi:MAG: peptidylprolyl isomerase [bacterium]